MTAVQEAVIVMRQATDEIHRLRAVNDEHVAMLSECFLWIGQQDCTGQKEINRRALMDRLDAALRLAGRR